MMAAHDVESRVLKPVSAQPSRTVQDIVNEVAGRYQLQPRDLKKGGGQDPLRSKARSEAMALVQSQFKYGLIKIGVIFGGYHHSNVKYLIRKAGRPEPVGPSATKTREELTEEILRLWERVSRLERVMGL